MHAVADRPPCVLSIAGSDSGGGAGIQADLKAFARCRTHGMTAITALTAQSTVGVGAVHAVPPEIIVAQVREVAEDIGVDAVKIGMLGNVETIEAVERALELLGAVPVVLDPVMVAESGAPLLAAEARGALVQRLLPRATVATPNVMEASALVGSRPADGAGGDALDESELVALAGAVHALGPRSVVVTGGHLAHATDVFFDGKRAELLPGELYPGGAAHGSGCTHSSSLAAQLALGLNPLAAAREAKRIASEAVRDGLTGIGQGAGPVNVLGLGTAAGSRLTGERAAAPLT